MSIWPLLWRSGQCLVRTLGGAALLNLFLAAPLPAAPHFLTQAQVEWPGQAPVEVQLPHFLHQTHSGLMQVSWRVQLTTRVHQQQLPALLIPQPIQGLIVKVGQQTVYRLEPSSAQTLHHWYRPVLIPLPVSLFESAIPPVVHIEQTGHLRGWYIAPVVQGELSELQTWHDRFLFLSDTLPTLVNGLSLLVGLFVALIGWRTKSVSYFYGGLTTVTWAILFSLALISALPTESWFIWRLMLYLCTGNLIYCVIRFMLAIFRQDLPRWLHIVLFLILQAGWMLFAILGQPVEAWLDVVWTALAVGLYSLASLVVVWRGMQRSEWHKMTALALHGALTAILALHDYVLQAGRIDLSGWEALPVHWFALISQPIYLTHLALPVFVIMSLWLLAQDHLQHRIDTARHAGELMQQRARIVGDIHDGVGARLNLMLWRMRTEPLASNQIQDELERSIEELRFAINPDQTGHFTLASALENMCSRFVRLGADLGIQVHWHNRTAPLALRSTQGLQLYKAAHECVSNAMRHSAAHHITVTLSAHAGVVQLVIEDDGQGIPGWNQASQQQSQGRPTSMGLKSVQQRLTSIGGQAHIQSGAGGTCVVLQIPLELSDSTTQ